jgi:hypothetical protein
MKSHWGCGVYGSLVLLGIMITGCAATSTSTTGAWSESQTRQGPFQTVLVVGIAEDKTMRRAFEVTLAEAITDGGSKGISSYVIGRQEGARELSRDNVVFLAQKSGADAVVVTRVVSTEAEADKSQEEAYVHIGPTVSVTQNEDKSITTVMASNYSLEVVPGTDVLDAHAVLETTVWGAKTGDEAVYRGTIDANFELGPGDTLEMMVSSRAIEVAQLLREDGVVY